MTTAIDQPKEPEAAPPPPPAPAAGDGHGFLGHPGGLATLSGLEVWERFSFLGMQATLALYFADTAAHGGLGMDPGTAASVTAAYGTWTGLGLISAGTGLLKPNVASMVGRLYRTDDERRDAGFALHYTAITTGAFAGPLIAGWLGEHQGWHRGFSAAAVGMTAGLAQYVLGRNRLPDDDAAAPYALAPDARRTALRRIAAGGLLLAALATLLAAIGWLTMPRFVDLLTLVSVIAPVLYFTLMFRSPRVTAAERGRLRPYDVLLETSGMSATTRLAPSAYAGQTMALWFLSLALANGIQAQVVKLYGHVSTPAYFGVNGAVAVAAALAVIAAAPWLRRTMTVSTAGVH